MLRWRSFVLATILVVATGASYAAERYAILIGVNDYTSLYLNHLRGPRNDILLMQRVLTETHSIPADHITMLGDGIAGAADPTLANIRAALNKAVATAHKGDFFYIHFSGHGTQQVDLNGDEADGRDEVILPRDADYSRDSKTITNALVDDEIGQYLHDLMAAGADVWLVLDSCSSGTATRGVPAARQQSRGIDPATLGVAFAAPFRLQDNPEAHITDNLPADAGHYVAFSAAQSDATASELAFSDQDTPKDSDFLGLFTAKLAARLERSRSVRYRALFEAIMSDINASAGALELVQTPAMEGNMQDAPIIVGGDSMLVEQFPIEAGDTIRGGVVQGLTPGTILAAYADATDPDDKALGYLRAVSVDPLTSTVEAVSGDCATAPTGPKCVAVAASSLAGARFARVVAPALDLVLKLSPPIDLAAKPDPARSLIETALHHVMSLPADQLGASVAITADDPQVALGISQGTLWVEPSGRFYAFGDRDLPPSRISWQPADGEQALSEIIRKLAKVQRLRALGAALSRAQADGRPPPIDIESTLARSDPTKLSKTIDPSYSTAEECKRANPQAGATMVAMSNRATLKQCDRIAFRGRLTGSQKYTVNVVHIDSLLNISVEQTLFDGSLKDQPIGQSKGYVVCSECVGRGQKDIGDYGNEEMVLVISLNEQNTMPLDLSGWAQTGVSRAVRGEPSSDIIAELTRPRSGTRGTLSSDVPSRIWVKTIGWRVLPREVAISGVIATN